MSQTDAILADLFAGRAITPKDALQRHGCFRLAAVVHALRADGFKIHSEMVSAKKRNGDVAAFARYTLTDRRRARSLTAQRALARIAAKPAHSKRRSVKPAKRAGRRA